MYVKASVLLFSVAVVSCAQFPQKNERETLLFNPEISAQTLQVSVMSNGCTEAQHFYLRVAGNKIDLRRTQPDLCRMAPQLIRLSFDYPFESQVYQFRNKVRFSNRVERR